MPYKGWKINIRNEKKIQIRDFLSPFSNGNEEIILNNQMTEYISSTLQNVFENKNEDVTPVLVSLSGASRTGKSFILKNILNDYMDNKIDTVGLSFLSPAVQDDYNLNRFIILDTQGSSTPITKELKDFVNEDLVSNNDKGLDEIHQKLKEKKK